MCLRIDLMNKSLGVLETLSDLWNVLICTVYIVVYHLLVLIRHVLVTKVVCLRHSQRVCSGYLWVSLGASCASSKATTNNSIILLSINTICTSSIAIMSTIDAMSRGCHSSFVLLILSMIWSTSALGTWSFGFIFLWSFFIL
jgi:hypothetical protein